MKTMKQLFSNLIKSRGGMTLVEIVVAFAIIALAALTLVAAIGTAGNIIRRGADLENASDSAYAGAEISEEATEGKVTFRSGGIDYEVEGNYLEGTKTVNDMEQTYRYFDPK